jgi:hypothetical protein
LSGCSEAATGEQLDLARDDVVGFIAGRDDSMDWVVAQWSNGGDNTRDIEVQRSAVADQVLQRWSDPRRRPLV